jgi:AhpD family alkylhydroperoxidase
MSGRTYTPRTVAVEFTALVRASPRLFAIYRCGRMEPGLRERVMVAVSRANACASCTRVHEAWALRTGVPPDELERIGAGELAAIPAAQRPAIVYATALSEARFQSVTPDAQAVADAQLDPERQRDIEAIARLITFANLSVNTAHALARNLRDKTTAAGARSLP